MYIYNIHTPTQAHSDKYVCWAASACGRNDENESDSSSDGGDNNRDSDLSELNSEFSI